MTAHAAFQIAAAAAIAAALAWLPAGATDVLIPPVTGIACLPDGGDISGCDDKVFMPYLAVTPVTGEGNSGILPARGKQ